MSMIGILHATPCAVMFGSAGDHDLPPSVDETNPFTPEFTPSVRTDASLALEAGKVRSEGSLRGVALCPVELGTPKLIVLPPA